MENILTIFTCFIVFLGAAEGYVTCHHCTHEVYTSDDPYYRASWLASISDYDSNCLNHGSDYTEGPTDTCFGECIKEFGTAVLRIGTSRVHLVVAQRGCSTTSNRAGSCRQLTIQNLVDDHGFTVESEDVTGCYCNDDYCNHGNMFHPKPAIIFFMVVLVVIGMLFG